MNDIENLIRSRLNEIDRKRENAKKQKRWAFVGKFEKGAVAAPLKESLVVFYDDQPEPEGTVFWAWNSSVIEHWYINVTRRAGLVRKWLTDEEFAERFGKDRNESNSMILTSEYISRLYW